MSRYQGGPSMEIFSPQGTDPLKGIAIKGRVKRQFDKDLKGYSLVCDGGASTRVDIPNPRSKRSLGITQRFLMVQMFLAGPEEPFSLELTLLDNSRTRRRLVISSGFRTILANPLHVQLPLGSVYAPNHDFGVNGPEDALVPRGVWFSLCIDLHDMVAANFPGNNCRTLEGFAVSGHCRLRRVFTLRDPPQGLLCDEEDKLHRYAKPVPRSLLFPSALALQAPTVLYSIQHARRWVTQSLEHGADVRECPMEQARRAKRGTSSFASPCDAKKRDDSRCEVDVRSHSRNTSHSSTPLPSSKSTASRTTKNGSSRKKDLALPLRSLRGYEDDNSQVSARSRFGTSEPESAHTAGSPHPSARPTLKSPAAGQESPYSRQAAPSPIHTTNKESPRGSARTSGRLTGRREHSTTVHSSPKEEKSPGKILPAILRARERRKERLSNPDTATSSHAKDSEANSFERGSKSGHVGDTREQMESALHDLHAEQNDGDTFHDPSVHSKYGSEEEGEDVDEYEEEDEEKEPLLLPRTRDTNQNSDKFALSSGEDESNANEEARARSGRCANSQGDLFQVPSLFQSSTSPSKYPEQAGTNVVSPKHSRTCHRRSHVPSRSSHPLVPSSEGQQHLDGSQQDTGNDVVVDGELRSSFDSEDVLEGKATQRGAQGMLSSRKERNTGSEDFSDVAASDNYWNNLNEGHTLGGSDASGLPVDVSQEQDKPPFAKLLDSEDEKEADDFLSDHGEELDEGEIIDEGDVLSVGSSQCRESKFEKAVDLERALEAERDQLARMEKQLEAKEQELLGDMTDTDDAGFESENEATAGKNWQEDARSSNSEDNDAALASLTSGFVTKTINQAIEIQGHVSPSQSGSKASPRRSARTPRDSQVESPTPKGSDNSTTVEQQEKDSTELDLIFDPLLDCYYCPKTDKYFRKKS